MLDYNFLRPPCMLAPYPKGFFIGTWEDYRGGVPLAEPTYLSFICDGWSIKSRPGTFSPHRSPKKPIMGVGSGGERARKPPPLFHQLSLRQKNAPDPKKLRMQCERAEKRATAWFNTTSNQTNKNMSSNLDSKSGGVWLAIKRFREKSLLKEIVKNTFSGHLVPFTKLKNDHFSQILSPIQT